MVNLFITDSSAYVDTVEDVLDENKQKALKSSDFGAFCFICRFSKEHYDRLVENCPLYRIIFDFCFCLWLTDFFDSLTALRKPQSSFVMYTDYLLTFCDRNNYFQHNILSPILKQE